MPIHISWMDFIKFLSTLIHRSAIASFYHYVGNRLYGVVWWEVDKFFVSFWVIGSNEKFLVIWSLGQGSSSDISFEVLYELLWFVSVCFPSRIRTNYLYWFVINLSIFGVSALFWMCLTQAAGPLSNNQKLFSSLTSLAKYSIFLFLHHLSEVGMNG